jgi:Tfp pilus assembly protein PilN
MRAVNLLPGDYRRGKRGGGAGLSGPAYVIVGVLTLALGLVTLYVVTTNSVNSQKSKLTAIRQQIPQVQALAAQLGPYSQFASLAQQRAQTVRQIAATRFDWAASMSDLSKVVPANTSLQSLNATMGTGSAGGSASSSSSGAGASSSGLRQALPDPAFELRGCTASQDDVARLMSRLRLMNGVVRVTLSNASKQGTGGAAGATGGGASSSSSGATATCTGSNFDLVVFFTGPPATGGASSGQSSAAPAASSSAAPATSSAAPAASSSGQTAGSHP